MTDIVELTTTVPSLDEAKRIAVSLVETRLAACVQILGPITSVYRWQESIQSDQEWKCVVKTQKSRASEVLQVIESMHAYEVPEVLVHSVSHASQKYNQWLVDSTEPPGRS